MASAKRKKNQSGSAQVGDWRFTYQDRIGSFRDVDFGEGDAALSAYALLFARVERILFARFCAGTSLTSLKNDYLVKYRIPARMFNSIRVSLEGKVSAVRESMNRHIESLKTRIKRAEAQIAYAIERGDLNAAHQKKRRLSILAGRLASVLADKASGRVRLCFGSKKFWRKQYHLEANGYVSHDDWLADWRAARSDEFFVLGSKDKTSGCQMCVATVQDDGRVTLRLRLPDALTAKHGKYLVMEDVHFHVRISRLLKQVRKLEATQSPTIAPPYQNPTATKAKQPYSEPINPIRYHCHTFISKAQTAISGFDH